ncbi:MAG: VacB/RNase II family 3'-5' exoribonuclease [Natronospirillum sp.]|uniref:VacB/RNase II family 3'-5' exoribonuclease n=1 Tax=Natronospirillum sp. TaxID=2812955 RepID=UPI0025FC8B78|nr:VacB/RNase II family 3'-5' exoribonuclease [Natronospirillum sp.]MCH8551863.1 VacB/RNase II family 3'-5' exoribonuclease [Natronospirillum sp.]
MLDSNALSQLASLKTQLNEDKDLFVGDVRGTPNRYGFVVTEAGESHFLNPDEMKRVLPGDRIEFTLADQDGRSQAVVEQLLETRLDTFVGQVVEKSGRKWVRPDHPGFNRWVMLNHKSAESAAEGSWVKCTLKRHPFEDGRALARVDSVLGDDKTLFIEHIVAKARFGATAEFPSAVQKAVAKLDATARLAAQHDYEDATDLPLVTIDGTNTRDMDDAVCVADKGNSWQLSVAIADPSLFVDAGSALDQSALQRYSSQYLPGETLHMLPPEIAVEQCALQADVERPALLLQTRLDKATGVASDTRIVFARVRSRAQLNYGEVSGWLKNGIIETTTRPLSDVTPEALLEQLQALDQLAARLHSFRQERCMVMPERPDYRLRLDERGQVTAIEEEERNRAQQMIEEVMLLTNHLAARHLTEHKAGLFLCHDGFREEQVDTVRQLLEQALGKVPEDLSAFQAMLPVLQQARQHDGLPLDRLLSKCYRRTELAAEPRPHWGLGFTHYTTITSPIRKYLDLFLHRQLKALWRGEPVPQATPEQLARMQEAQGSMRAVANFTEHWLKAIYLKPREGEVVSGEIQHLTPTGFSVQLDGLGVSGFVNVKGWRDKTAEFDPVWQVHHTAKGEFRLEMPVQVKIQSVDLERRNIQLEIASG